jgi:hypothetical protein
MCMRRRGRGRGRGRGCVLLAAPTASHSTHTGNFSIHTASQLNSHRFSTPAASFSLNSHRFLSLNSTHTDSQPTQILNSHSFSTPTASQLTLIPSELADAKRVVRGVNYRSLVEQDGAIGVVHRRKSRHCHGRAHSRDQPAERKLENCCALAATHPFVRLL